MEPANVNRKGFKKCAFCKHWYDPTDSVIKLNDPKIGLWEFDSNMKNICILNNCSEMPSFVSCSKYECKL